MPKYVRLGRRPDDIAGVWDFENLRNLRGMVRTNTDVIAQAIPLELIPMGKSGYGPGMILIHRDWKDIYGVIEREGWTEDDYFEYANKRFVDLGIERP